MTIARHPAAGSLRPQGAYSLAVRHGDVVYTSGVLPIDPATGVLIEGDIAAQTRQVILNIQTVLEAADSSLDRVLRAGVFLTDRALWDDMNAIFDEFFGDVRPARTTVEVGPLSHGALVEIDVVAAASE